MPLSNEERDRIREEEWVRLQAREDFYRTNPGYGRFGRFGPYGRQTHPGFIVGIVAVVFFFIVAADIAEKINWNHLVR